MVDITAVETKTTGMSVATAMIAVIQEDETTTGDEDHLQVPSWKATLRRDMEGTSDRS